jgi:hypothetical protein
MANKYTDAAFAVRGLKPMQKLVLWVVCQRTDNADGTCYPSHTRIAEDAGIHRITAMDAMKELISRGLVAVVGRHGGANRYQVSLSKMQELSTGTRGSTGVVAYSYSASSAPLPEELPTATTLVASGYSNSSCNSSCNEVKEGSEGEAILVCNGANSASSTGLAVTPEYAPPKAAVLPSTGRGQGGVPECENLTQLMLSLLGESSGLFTKATAANMRVKAKEVLSHFSYEELEPVLRWVFTPESDDRTFSWRSVISGANNPMAMFAKHAPKIVEKFCAYERKHRTPAEGTAAPKHDSRSPRVNDTVTKFWGNIQSFTQEKETAQ